MKNVRVCEPLYSVILFAPSSASISVILFAGSSASIFCHPDEASSASEWKDLGQLRASEAGSGFCNRAALHF
jgi:hypothetical protein